uniref:SERPIN domain-containing protein n=1 Tax=Parastrongyloides trichosuri TaxID=131310 RepID=A0A0N4Z6J2_PARTI
MSRKLSIIHADLAIKVVKQLVSYSAIVYSPISLAIAFSMAYMGSSGDTKEEIKKFFVGEESDDSLHERFNQFMTHLDNTIKSVNKIYVKEGLKLEDGFVDGLKKYYNGQFEQIEFTSPDAAEKINKFVEESTNNIIKDLINQNDLNSLTSSILINAIYFKGGWEKQFLEENTSSDDFYISNSNVKKIDMMFKKDKYNYYENEEYQIISLNYEGNQQRMVILLPKERSAFPNNISSFKGEQLFDMIDSMDMHTVKLYLPKFEIESSHQLVDILKNLGLTKPFDEFADFSLMCTEEQLYVSKIIQKAYIEVNEKGTEAAAATAMIMMCRTSMIHRPQIEYVFKADHPFMYFIMDREDNILFNGLYM